ncbi:MAG: hypothetical protein H7Z76_07520 [Methylotenera sp.]|nr:hypothetical protein [Flavobacterium sp.]
MKKINSPQPIYKIELTYAELSDLCGIVYLQWVQSGMNMDHMKTLADKLAVVKKEIVTKNLN